MRISKMKLLGSALVITPVLFLWGVLLILFGWQAVLKSLGVIAATIGLALIITIGLKLIFEN